ncbi:MAG TPA: LysR family transcriptional regulator [Roseiarcus sp.]|jgi:DNA-binding transcriptional LysR family regulator|nr:LysR family transcriptional regulator [Roseiarcus sp.]
MRSIPVDVLRAFVAVVEARGFTRAAEDLGRSQPTVSLQVKRLEELVEAPLFERVARFELSPVGAVCFEYGKRLIRLHDEMLEEAALRKAPLGRLRVGMSSEFASRLTPRLVHLRAQAGSGFEVITDASDSLAAAFRQKELDIAIVVGTGREFDDAERWRAPLGWFGSGVSARTRKKPLPLVVPPQGSALHEAAVGALRAAGLAFDIVCASGDLMVLASAASAGLGVTPMIEGFAPDGLKPVADKSLPALPPVTFSLIARSPALASAGRLWVADALGAFEPL